MARRIHIKDDDSITLVYNGQEVAKLYLIGQDTDHKKPVLTMSAERHVVPVYDRDDKSVIYHQDITKVAHRLRQPLRSIGEGVTVHEDQALRWADIQGEPF